MCQTVDRLHLAIKVVTCTSLAEEGVTLRCEYLLLSKKQYVYEFTPRFEKMPK
jgi:hypothetical protein